MGCFVRFLLWLAILVAFAGCRARSPSPESPCGATCDAWTRLGCEEAEPTPVSGVTCVELCLDTEVYERLPHSCIQTARDCAEARDCR